MSISVSSRFNRHITVTKHQLLSLLTMRGVAEASSLGYPGSYLSAIEREDGTGSSFNLTLVDITGEEFTVYVRTLD